MFLRKSIFTLTNPLKFLRNLTVAQPKEEYGRIKAWQVHSFGENLQCCSIREPLLIKPSEVLVKVEAASVNPLDVLMKDGYGRAVLKFFKCDDLVLPLTLGRDFCGIVINKGHGVGDDLKVGDKVYGVVPFNKQGTHAESVVVDKCLVLPKPVNLSHTECASVPYAALTAYSALWYTGGLCLRDPKGMRVLILGASGGVGTLAVQMLRSEGVMVVATCATDAIPLVQGLGAHCVVDYRSSDYFRIVAEQGNYDIILDCAKLGYESIPPSWQYSQYVSLSSPLLKNTDQYGILGGFMVSAANIIPANVLSISQGRLIKWAYFYPSRTGLKFIHKLLEECQLTPVIEKVYSFSQLLEAYEKVKAGHNRGKIVIDMIPSDE